MTVPTRPQPTSRPGSYGRAAGNVVLILVGLGVVGVLRHRDLNAPQEKTATPPRPVPEASSVVAWSSTPAPEMPLAPVTLPIDKEAVAQAEREAEAVRHDRVSAETRAAASAAALRAEATRLATATLARKTLPSTMRDPTSKLTRAASRGAVIQSEIDKLRSEGASLARIPKPRAKPLIDKSPVARITEGEEFHFEVRQGRVAFIDLEKLMDKVRTDARIRLRVAGVGARRIGGEVGPIGVFSLQYEMARESDVLEEVLDMRGMTFQLVGWELVPESNVRGETFETARMSASEFSRAVNRLRPGKSTVTMWIYPDGFEVYRQLRDLLHDRGFLVAARPLPAGIPIRGSPGGSASAGQ